MFYFKGEYVSTILINGVSKLIAKIGRNVVWYNCMTNRIEQIGLDKVVYDDVLGRIAKIGELDVVYGITGCMTNIGALVVEYDEAGSIVRIGDSTVFYVNAPTSYEPLNGFYSPIHADSPLRHYGLTFESANRLKMEGLVGELSNDDSVGRALLRIGLNLQEQSKARDQNDSLYDGYNSAALQFGAIQKIANLLCHQDSKIRCKARKVLLAFHESVQINDLATFHQQIKAVASLIMNVTKNTVLAFDGLEDNALHDEMSAALEVLFMLPFDDQEIQALVIEKDMVQFLTGLRTSVGALASLIDQNIGKILTSPSRGTARNLAQELTEVDLESVEESEQGTPVPHGTRNLDTKVQHAANPDLPNPAKVTVEALKVYYYAHSLWSKQKKHIFKNGAELNGVVNTLRDRAAERPGYASDKTLSHFKLK